MQRTTVEERRERVDLIYIDEQHGKNRKDQILKRKADRYLTTQTKLQKGICLYNTKKYSFPQRNIDTWNGLKEKIIMANIYIN